MFDLFRTPAAACAAACALLTGAAPAASSPPAAAAPSRALNILFLGDSLTAGYGLDASQAYPALIAKKLAAAQPAQRWNVVNAGVSGDTAAGGLRRLDWQLRQPVDFLVLALGANDGLRGQDPAATEAALQGIIERTRAKNPAVRVLLVGMLMPENLGADFRARFAAIFPRLAQKNSATLVPFLLEGVALDAQLNQPDGIHPNAAGQQILAETVWKYLSPLLPVKNPGGAASPDGGTKSAQPAAPSSTAAPVRVP